MSETNAAEHPQDSTPPRRTTQRVLGGFVLILLSLALFAIGIQSIVDPSEVIANSSNSPRSPDTDAEAQFAGLLMCMFGITVLGFGIHLFNKKTAANTSAGNKAD